MKKLLILSALFASFAAHAVNFEIVALVTTTNAPNTDGSSFAINGDVRTATNAISSTTYATNTSIGGITTNLFRHIIRFKFVGEDRAEWISTNSFKIWMKQGYTITNVLVGTNFSVTLTTNTIGATKTNVSVPAANAYSQSDATNVLTQLAYDLSVYNRTPVGGSYSNLTLLGITTFGAGLTISDGEILASSIEMDGSGVIADNDNGIPIIDFANDSMMATTVYGYHFRIAGGGGEDIPSYFGMAFPRTNLTTLANGNNSSLYVGSGRTYVKVSGPSGAFAICSITNGYDGKILTFQNSTGQTMTIANESGVDGTVANRILTGKNADISITNNPGIAKFIYDSDLSRWIYTGGN